MVTRKSILLIAAAIALAAASFLLGSYVFPHAGGEDTTATTNASSSGSSPAAPGTAGEPSAGSSAATDSAGLASFGIDVPTGPGTAPTPGTAPGGTLPGSETLDDTTLASLDAPVQGFIAGRVTSSGDPTRTAEVRVDMFRIALKASDGSLSTYTLPAGSTVQLYFGPAHTGPGPNTIAVPEPGAAIQANVRVEPATSASPARISVVDIQVMGSPQ